MFLLAEIVHRIFQLFVLIVVVKVILSYFMPPYSQVRIYIDQIVEPALAPIRRIMPQTGMFDFSPMVLIILLWIIDSIITGIIRSLAV